MYQNADFTGLDQLLGAYLARPGLPDAASLDGRFAVACPVDGEQISLTNLDWRFSIGALRDGLGLNSLQVTNDFSALALALPWLGGDDVVRLTEGVAHEDRAKLVLGPGTGLGVSGLVPSDGAWAPVAGEGGHVSFAPQNALEARVLERLWARFEHVSTERVLAGPGLALLYRTLEELDGGAGSPLSPREVVERARAGEERARHTLDVYFAMLGSAAGDLALALGARGGVFLAGGILPRTIEELRASRYREAFVAKGRLRPFLEQIPSFLIVHPFPALLGLSQARDLP